ncbi:MAG: hypothetical protein GC160_01815 [Acidobacteria bacterium]|nr:hypothetical protein [Acidobacteriota bacterium]
MPALLPPLALSALFLALVSRGSEWRRGFLLALLGGALWVWLLTEGLSLFGALGQPALAVGWGLAALAALACVRWRELSSPFGGMSRPWLDTLLLATTVVVAAFSASAAFLSAVYGAPNLADVLYYHLPRVVYWLQNGSVEFFPANYYQELSLQPMAEYMMAQMFALGGGDRFVQLVQWTSFLGSIAGVSRLAALLGAGFAGQAIAAGLVAVAPNAILQASGAKNDLTAGFFLVAAACFALEAAETRSRGSALAAGLAAGFALLTKGTAYLFAPGLAVGVLLGLDAGGRRALLRLGPVIAVAALAVNLPHAVRNYAYNGHPLGEGSSDGGGVSRYSNERFGADVLLSNLLRNAFLELATTPERNEELVDTILGWHEALGIDPHDPDTSFNREPFRAFHVTGHPHHEVIAPNLLQTLLLVPLAVWLLWRRRLDAAAGLSIGVLLGFVTFCAILKWQPWHARMHTPLMLLACAPIGMMLGAPRRPWLGLAVLVGAASYAFPIALDNENRPLSGPNSVFAADRYEQYFLEFRGQSVEQYLAAEYALHKGCRRVAIDAQRDFGQYAVQIALLEADPATQLRLSGVFNPSNRYRPKGWFDDACAVICLRCGPDPKAREQYGEYGKPARFDDVLVFLKQP